MKVLLERAQKSDENRPVLGRPSPLTIVSLKRDVVRKLMNFFFQNVHFPGKEGVKMKNKNLKILKLSQNGQKSCLIRSELDLGQIKILPKSA